jgi:hypothetical protein
MIPESKDEMCYNYLLHKPNIFVRKDVTATEFSGGKRFLSWMVSPFNAHSQNLTDVGRGLSFGSFAFASCFNRKWRGTIVYKVRVIKTAFHSGRFVMVYFPGLSILDQPTTLGESISSGYNVICDLNLKNEGGIVEYEFAIPFTSNQAWKRTMLTDPDGFPNSLTQVTANGSVGMYVLNDLVFPDSVSDTITFLVSYTGGSDYEVAIPTLTLAAGFPETTTPDISSRVAEMLNGMVSYFDTDYPAGSNPTFVDNDGNIQINQVTSNAEYDVLIGQPLVMPNGTHPANITVTIDDFVPYNTTLNVSIVDSVITAASTGDKLENTAAVSTITVVYFVCTATLRAQSGDSVSNLVIPSTKAYDANVETIGEYNNSLRSIMKRCGPSRMMHEANPFQHNIVEFSSFDPPAPETPREGYRFTRFSDTQGYILPETWFSLVSYLYRFYGGATRVKVFSDSGAQLRATLAFSETKNMRFGNDLRSATVEQLSNVNNALEITLPYYSEVRARCVGGPWTTEGPQVLLELYNSQSNPVPVYEAAADDFSFFFQIGPPVMHLAENDLVSPPLMVPPANLRIKSS